ncbi:hypothetical protein Peur_034769 [Populus x canadensis]
MGFSQNHMDMVIVGPDMFEWRLTGFYGFPGRRRLRESLNLLRALSRRSNLPWKTANSPISLSRDIKTLGRGVEGTQNWVQERLDRAFSIVSWLSHFKEVELLNLTSSTSDHSPIQLIFRKQIGHRKHFRFRFENSWIREQFLKQRSIVHGKALWVKELLTDLISVQQVCLNGAGT